MNFCMIPVRKGSKAGKKNYLKINGKTIYQIAIEKHYLRIYLIRLFLTQMIRFK